ncbi:hypothetical protein BDF14DRAFT_1835959 [Spinellus fusiger]|nr:hypothetical protein BDF14DRAFT_1835959 [Spinellus fusiger]
MKWLASFTFSLLFSSINRDRLDGITKTGYSAQVLDLCYLSNIIFQCIFISTLPNKFFLSCIFNRDTKTNKTYSIDVSTLLIVLTLMLTLFS